MKLAYLLVSSDNLREAVRLSQLLTRPYEPPLNVTLPCGSTLREWGIKLDQVAMAFERHVHLEGRLRVSRSIGPDTSPQHGQNYMCVKEERMVRPHDCLLPVPFNPFKGFHWVRRNMPLAVLGKTNTATAATSSKIAHVIILECSVAGLNSPNGGFRRQCKNYISDQAHTEAKVARGPNVVIQDGKLGDLQTRENLQKMRSSTSTALIFESYFLPYALDIRGTLHINGNAVRHAIEAIPEWKLFEPILRAWCNLVGKKETKDLILELFKDSDKYFRHIIHSWNTDHIDWRWLELLFVLSPLAILWPELRRVGANGKWAEMFNTVTADGDARKNVRFVTQGIENDWVEPFIEATLVFVTATGKVHSWCLGCYCHHNLRQHEATAHHRRKAMHAELGDDFCPWTGKQCVPMALGMAAVHQSWVRGASSERFRSMLLCLHNTGKAGLAQRAVVILQSMADSWCCVWEMKNDVWKHPPHRGLGAFGEYFGYTREEAQAATRECFATIDALISDGELGQIDPLSLYL